MIKKHFFTSFALAAALLAVAPAYAEESGQGFSQSLLESMEKSAAGAAARGQELTPNKREMEKASAEYGEAFGLEHPSMANLPQVGGDMRHGDTLNFQQTNKYALTVWLEKPTEHCSESDRCYDASNGMASFQLGGARLKIVDRAPLTVQVCDKGQSGGFCSEEDDWTTPTQLSTSTLIEGAPLMVDDAGIPRSRWNFEAECEETGQCELLITNNYRHGGTPTRPLGPDNPNTEAKERFDAHPATAIAKHIYEPNPDGEDYNPLFNYKSLGGRRDENNMFVNDGELANQQECYDLRKQAMAMGGTFEVPIRCDDPTAGSITFVTDDLVGVQGPEAPAEEDDNVLGEVAAAVSMVEQLATHSEIDEITGKIEIFAGEATYCKKARTGFKNWAQITGTANRLLAVFVDDVGKLDCCADNPKDISTSKNLGHCKVHEQDLATSRMDGSAYHIEGARTNGDKSICIGATTPASLTLLGGEIPLIGDNARSYTGGIAGITAWYEDYLKTPKICGGASQSAKATAAFALGRPGRDLYSEGIIPGVFSLAEESRVYDREYYCSFPSMLARIFHEQGRKQINYLATQEAAGADTIEIEMPYYGIERHEEREGGLVVGDNVDVNQGGETITETTPNPSQGLVWVEGEEGSTKKHKATYNAHGGSGTLGRDAPVLAGWQNEGSWSGGGKTGKGYIHTFSHEGVSITAGALDVRQIRERSGIRYGEHTKFYLKASYSGKAFYETNATICESPGNYSASNLDNACLEFSVPSNDAPQDVDMSLQEAVGVDNAGNPYVYSSDTKVKVIARTNASSIEWRNWRWITRPWKARVSITYDIEITTSNGGYWKVVDEEEDDTVEIVMPGDDVAVPDEGIVVPPFSGIVTDEAQWLPEWVLNSNRFTFWQWDGRCHPDAVSSYEAEVSEALFEQSGMCPLSKGLYMAVCDTADCGELPKSPFDATDSEWTVHLLDTEQALEVNALNRYMLSQGGCDAEDNSCRYKVSALPRGAGGQLHLDIPISWSRYDYDAPRGGHWDTEGTISTQNVHFQAWVYPPPNKYANDSEGIEEAIANSQPRVRYCVGMPNKCVPLDGNWDSVEEYWSEEGVDKTWVPPIPADPGHPGQEYIPPTPGQEEIPPTDPVPAQPAEYGWVAKTHTIYFEGTTSDTWADGKPKYTYNGKKYMKLDDIPIYQKLPTGSGVSVIPSYDESAMGEYWYKYNGLYHVLGMTFPNVAGAPNEPPEIVMKGSWKGYVELPEYGKKTFSEAQILIKSLTKKQRESLQNKVFATDAMKIIYEKGDKRYTYQSTDMGVLYMGIVTNPSVITVKEEDYKMIKPAIPEIPGDPGQPYIPPHPGQEYIPPRDPTPEVPGYWEYAGEASIGGPVELKGIRIHDDPEIWIRGGDCTDTFCEYRADAYVKIEAMPWLKKPMTHKTKELVYRNELKVAGQTVVSKGSYNVPYEFRSHPNCEGFSLEQFMALDMSQIDISEYVETVTGKAKENLDDFFN